MARSHIFKGNESKKKMIDPTIPSKVTAFFQTFITDQLCEMYDMLLRGDLRQAEHLLVTHSMEFHTMVMKAMLPAAAKSFSQDHEAPRGVKCVMRPHRIRIATGHQVELLSPYHKVAISEGEMSRRPLLDHWQMIDGFSPLLYDRIGYMSMLAPSYDLAHEGVTKFGMDVCLSSVQKITYRLAERCDELGHEHLIIEPGYDLEDKTVVVSIDGGRSRVREYTNEINEHGRAKYDTPWREPKLFVIDVLDENGRPDQQELPIYGCQFNEEDVLHLLERYLIKLDIKRAKHVQLVADGAPWIWNRVPKLLRNVGVRENQLTQTLDFYHATQYIHNLVEAMPKRITKKVRKRLLNDFLGHMKAGEISHILGNLRAIFKRPGSLVKRWIGYLDKHKSRMQYADYEDSGLMRGSGIIESAIRRIINLRFKNASTFWLADNVEKLYFLRAALVAGRWNIVMDNIAKSP